MPPLVEPAVLLFSLNLNLSVCTYLQYATNSWEIRTQSELRASRVRDHFVHSIFNFRQQLNIELEIEIAYKLLAISIFNSIEN